MSMKRLTAALLVLALALCGMALGEDTTQREMAPDFTLFDQYAVQHSLSDYRGQVVLLNFWTTWCPWCIREMPDLEALYHELGENSGSVVILGMGGPDTVDSVSEEEIVSFLEEHGFTYPCVMDRDGSLFSLWGVEALPTTWMIRADGTIMGYVAGALSREGMLEIINKTLADSGLEPVDLPLAEE
ncbi:MAG: TlpA family protein disulfide reductase [Clostridia bacterium]|nr:TlpA family protein disulfide reductase [Clostridia bacterium]